MTFSGNPFPRFLLPLLLIVLGGSLSAVLIPHEIQAVNEQLLGFPDSDVMAQRVRPIILAVLCFLPALGAALYAFGSILDRYMARQFLGIFGICLLALVMIWLLMDLSGNVSEFRETEQMWRTIVLHYLARSPAILMLLLPYSLLLALLYCLGKLSGAREIIAMIQAGRSVVRITTPLILAGLLLSLVSLALNYHLAPTAEGSGREVVSAASDIKLDKAKNVLFRNQRDRRLWEIGAFPDDFHKDQPLRNVEITTTGVDRRLEQRLSAKSALWDRETREWTFEKATVGNFTAGEPPKFDVMTEPLVVAGWSETPWQLVKPGLSAKFLGIPDLNSWLQEDARHGPTSAAKPYLTQWHYRWALPFTCMVTVLLATPLGIHFSRRGAGGGVFLAVVLSSLMLLISSISLALGEAGAIGPTYAAWLPNLIFGLLGLYLFRRRITGQPIYLILRRLLPIAD